MQVFSKGKGKGNCAGFLKGKGQGKLHRFSQRERAGETAQVFLKGKGKGNCTGSRSFSNLAEATAIILTCSYSYSARAFSRTPGWAPSTRSIRFFRLSSQLLNRMRSFEKFVTDFRSSQIAEVLLASPRLSLRSRFFSEFCHRRR